MSIVFLILFLVVTLLMVTSGSKLITGKADKRDVPRDGTIAFSQGYTLTDNPFRNHTPDHSIWRDDFLFSSRQWSAK